jgi:hypothetical protein
VGTLGDMNSRQVLSVLAGMVVFLLGAYLVLGALSLGAASLGELLLGAGVAVLGLAMALLGAYLTRDRRNRAPRREPRVKDARPAGRRATAQRS